MKKRGFIIVIIIGLFLVWGWSIYNGLVKKQEAMASAWSQVENVYQRRADLIPNLVAVVKNYAEYEQETLTAITEARAKAAASTVDMEHFDDMEFTHFESVQKELGNSINRLIVSIENYPDLKAIIFIVHEPTSVICGERPVLQHWFKENGFELKEWNQNEISYKNT